MERWSLGKVGLKRSPKENRSEKLCVSLQPSTCDALKKRSRNKRLKRKSDN